MSFTLVLIRLSKSGFCGYKIKRELSLTFATVNFANYIPLKCFILLNRHLICLFIYSYVDISIKSISGSLSQFISLQLIKELIILFNVIPDGRIN